MVRLKIDDQEQLLKLLTPLPILGSERGREAMLVTAQLEPLRPQLDLSGPSAIAVPLLLHFLCSYGRLSYDHEALGRFLSALQSHVGLEARQFFATIISNYGLMTPLAKQPVLGDVGDLSDVRGNLEKIIGENTLRPIAFLRAGLACARSVVYLAVRQGAETWSGTGFMLTPTLCLTNQHVLPQAKLLATTRFRFNYQDDVNGNPEPFTEYQADAEGLYLASEQLDYALVSIAGTPGKEWGTLSISNQPPQPGERVNIIQHPAGLPKQVSLQNNLVKYVDALKLQYITSTLPGSSGSPVFNDRWQVVGLHHAGGLLTEYEDGPSFFRNQGINIQAIVEALPAEIRQQLTLK